MENSWSKWAERREYQESPSLFKIPVIPDKLKLLMSLVKKGNKVLDIGAYNRSLEKKFEDYGRRVTYKSMDIDKSLSHDYYSLDEIKEKFDVIVCFEVIEHMPLEAGIEMLSRIYELLLPSGNLILSTPNICHPTFFWADPTHITPYHYEGLLGVLTSCGFEKIKIYRLAFGKSLRRRIRRRLCWYLNIDFAKSILITGKRPQE